MDPSAGDGGVPFGRGEDVWKDMTFPDGSTRRVRVPFFLKDYVSPPPVPWHEIPRYRTTGEIPPGWKEPLQPKQPLPPIDSDFIPFDMNRYNQQVQSSGGYDVDNMWGMSNLGLITPVCDRDLQRQRCYQHYEEYALFAIEQHNKGKEGGKLKLVKLLKVTTQSSCHPRIFVTFEAMDDTDGDDDTKIYQARVDIHPPTLVLGEFREKPRQQQTPAANIPIGDQSFAFGPVRWGTPLA